ncbi:MAG: hypothetical protein R3C32_01145 [Chloroflexota bacterium]
MTLRYAQKMMPVTTRKLMPYVAASPYRGSDPAVGVSSFRS